MPWALDLEDDFGGCDCDDELGKEEVAEPILRGLPDPEEYEDRWLDDEMEWDWYALMERQEEERETELEMIQQDIERLVHRKRAWEEDERLHRYPIHSWKYQCRARRQYKV